MSYFKEKTQLTFASFIYTLSILAALAFIAQGYYAYSSAAFFIEHRLRGAILAFASWLFIPGIFSTMLFGLWKGERHIIESLQNYRLLFAGATVMGLINYISWPAFPKEMATKQLWYWATGIIGLLHICWMISPTFEKSRLEKQDAEQQSKKDKEDAARFRQSCRSIESDS